MRRVSKDERARIALTLNGRKLSGEAEPRMLLSDFLRHVLGATGTHVGCEHGVCGCCTVLIDGTAVRSCLTLAVQAEGRAVTTVESLADGDGKLNALQQAFQNNHALQCGFCTPGILMSFTDFLARNPRSVRGRGGRGAQRPSLPLHRLCRHRRGRARGRRRRRHACREQQVGGAGGASGRSSHHRYRLADHRRCRAPHHPRCGDRGGRGQDRRGRQVGRSSPRHFPEGAASTAAARWRRRASSTAICIPRSSSRAGSPTRPMRSRSCSTACILTRRRSRPTTCGFRRPWRPPSCSSTASPASSIPATIIRRPRSKGSWRPASARSCRAPRST